MRYRTRPLERYPGQSGRFQHGSNSIRKKFLTGERQRWDDPDRPNVLHFTNGRFQAYWDP